MNAGGTQLRSLASGSEACSCGLARRGSSSAAIVRMLAHSSDVRSPLRVPSCDKKKASGARRRLLCSQYIYGARGNKLSEPLVLDTTYPIQWHEPRVDLAELAKLRYLEDWSRQRLASHYRRTLHAITNYCQTIRRKDFNLPGLTVEDKVKIRSAYQNRP